MRLLSLYSGRVFWRTFNIGDTVYVVGHTEGGVAEDTVIDINHPQGMFQLELRIKDLGGRHIVFPGAKWLNTDSLVLKADGSLQYEVDAAEVVVDQAFQFAPVGTVIQFFDRLGASSDSTIEVLSTIGYSSTSSQGQTAGMNSSATDESGAQVGATVKAEGNVGAAKVGVEVQGKLSDTVTQKIEQTVQGTRSVTIATTVSNATKQTIVAKAQVITVHTVSWRRQFIGGSVSFGKGAVAYEATLDYVSSQRTEEFPSLNAMPQHLVAEYRRQGL